MKIKETGNEKTVHIKNGEENFRRMRRYRRDIRHRPYISTACDGLLMLCNCDITRSADLPGSVDNRTGKTRRITKHKLDNLREKLDV